MINDTVPIGAWIEPKSRLLDLGCGDGTLLRRLIDDYQVQGYGLEIDPDSINQCIQKGLNVIEQDLNKGLKKPNKESLKGEALDGNIPLNELRKGLIETEALATRIKGLRDAYVSQYATVSRVIALRATVPDQV